MHIRQFVASRAAGLMQISLGSAVRKFQASEARDALPRDVARNTVRTLLERMEKKGWVTHREVGRTYLYRSWFGPTRTESIGLKVREIIETSLRRLAGDARCRTTRLSRPATCGELLRIRKMLDEAQAGAHLKKKMIPLRTDAALRLFPVLPRKLTRSRYAKQEVGDVGIHQRHSGFSSRVADQPQFSAFSSTPPSHFHIGTRGVPAAADAALIVRSGTSWTLR